MKKKQIKAISRKKFLNFEKIIIKPRKILRNYIICFVYLN